MRAWAVLGLLLLAACEEVDADTGIQPIPYCPAGLFGEDGTVFNDPTNPGAHQNAGQFYDRDLGTLQEGGGIIPGFGLRDTGADQGLFVGCEPNLPD